MILIGLGANLLHPIYGEPLETLKAALEQIKTQGIVIEKQSSWYRTEPVPVSEQPWFVNAVIAVSTDLAAEDLLQVLHQIEQKFGRVREMKWEARVLDLDLLAYDEYISENQDQTQGSVIPHPHMQDRAFVLVPIKEILEAWQHPRLGQGIDELLDGLDSVPEFEIVQS
jgi:2-amino-4-hydroxy-6-hydroxymethyldihydropteridine diphosphokinase